MAIEIVEDVKDFVGDKGFYLLLAGAGVLFMISLAKQNSYDNDTTLVSATGYTSYPDAETNADVIISTLQDSIEYSEKNITDNSNTNKSEIMGALSDMTTGITDQFGELGTRIEDSGNDLMDYLDNNFTATNDYINQGLQATDRINQTLSGIQSDMQSGFDSLGSKVESGTNLLYQQSIVQTQGISNALKQATGTAVGEVKKTSSNDTVSYYQYKTKSGLNTSTSIVDALKAIGVDSSFENRQAIAKKNGLANYSGSYSDNVVLLNRLKSGKLIK